jgi:predicted MFS family arabinose efflux permease
MGGTARTVHLLLASANFVVGMAAFMVIGILAPIAGSFAL